MAADPEAELEGFIVRFTPQIAALVRSCRAAMRAKFPAANEIVYDNYQALAIGYGPDEKTSHIYFSIAAFPKSVALSFYYGASLPDPDGLLSGSGKQNRFVRLTGPETLDEPGIAAIIQAAIAHGLPMGDAPGRTIIRSISAKQRPRRPLA